MTELEKYEASMLALKRAKKLIDYAQRLIEPTAKIYAARTFETNEMFYRNNNCNYVLHIHSGIKNLSEMLNKEIFVPYLFDSKYKNARAMVHDGILLYQLIEEDDSLK